MSKEWYLIRSPYYAEGTERSDYLFDTRMSFEDILSHSLQTDNTILCNGIFDGERFEEEFITESIIQNEVPDTSSQSWQRQILTRIGTLKKYKYVKHDNKIWLILSEPSNNRMYEKSILYLCNYIIKWQDENGVIHYKPCNIQNASQYNSGINETKQITIGYDQLMMYLSLDDETKSLPRDKRFFIDYDNINPTPYKITRLDTVSFSFGTDRTMHVVLTEDQYNSKTDNIDLMLCDYFIPVESTEPVEITYNGDSEIRCGGTTKTFTANTNKPVEWTLKTLDIQKDFVILTSSNNKAKLKCLNNKSLIGSSFKLICTVDDISSELLVDIVGGV